MVCWVFYCDKVTKEEKIGRNLGPCGCTVGAGDCYNILAETAKVVATNTVIAITEEDMRNRDLLRRMTAFDNYIEGKIGDGIKKTEERFSGFPDYGDLFDEHPDDQPIVMEKESLIPEIEQRTQEEHDKHIGAEVLLEVGGEQKRAVVKARAKDKRGNPIGTQNDNYILDTREYEVLFEDGLSDIYTSNIVMENIYTQIDKEGNMFVLMDEIIDHKKDATALDIAQGTYTTRNGTKQKVVTTKGWQLLVQWKDGTSSWVKLADLKESFPVKVADYARDNGIDSKPAFAWWTPYVLRKRSAILCKAKTKYWVKDRKYGICLPKTIKEALSIDRETGTRFWREAIEKEMKNVMIAFEFSDDDVIPVGHSELTVHMVFDVKITLQRKSRLVADGHKVPEVAKESTFSSVPTRDTIRLFFMLAALNDMDVLSADIQNAYLTAPTKEKYYIIAGEEFPEKYRGRPCKVVRALYGLPIAGNNFRSYLSKGLKALGWKPCKADPDLYMRVAYDTKGRKYYEYLLAYVDDILCCSMMPEAIMDAIRRRGFILKDGSVERPKIYLGADIKEFRFDHDPNKVRWVMSCANYTKKAVNDVKNKLKLEGLKLPRHYSTPLSSGY